ncbi:MAG: hypothetical protein KBC44_01625 [Candidatus Pacebacteria bacterium]|nr:hypothetical protein [Candidatus Paceibacterota bacterium]MBP9839663.1 hypothetical protein [Candidatus Paceibacterota bacterium]
MNSNVKVFISVVGILILGVITTAIVRGSGGEASLKSGKLDQFAQCLGDKGAVFYGAYWCPHCNSQKKMFGSSAKLLPYVECSTLDGQGQTQECKDKNITGYPTWEFLDGTRLSGEIALSVLSSKTSCPLPEDATDSPSIQGTSQVSPVVGQ